MKLRFFPTSRIFSLSSAITALFAATAPAIQAQTWSGATSDAWLNTANWTGGVAAGSTTVGDTDVAVFTNNTNTTARINFNTTGGVYHLGALDFTNNQARTVNNSSTTVAGILTLNGATVNSVANTIIRNSNSGLKTITNGTGSGTMGLALGNTTNNIIQITGAGGITINSIISGASDKTLTKQGTGAGSLTLGGANTYSGVTNVNEGTLLIVNNTALGSTAGNTIVASGATAYIVAPLTAFAEPLNITGTGVGGTTGAFRIGGGGSTLVQGAVTLGGNATIASDGGVTPTFTGGFDTAGNALTFNTSGTFTISTAGISGVNGSLINNAGTLNLNVASTYGGGTTVAGGTLSTGNATALGSTSGTLTVNGGTLNMAGNNITVGNLTGSGGIISGTSGARTLTIGQGDTGGGNFLGAINNGAGGTTALTKTGNGTIKLGSTSGYTGATAVSGGTLVVNGNISTSGSTTVSNGATLAGIGTVGTTTIQTTGVFAPGDSGIESLNTGALTLESGSISNFEINTLGDISDLAISSALLTFGGILNVSNIGGTLILGDTFNLFDWGSTTGAFSTVNLPTLTPGLSWNQSNLYTAGTITVIPEPNAASLLGGLGMLALLRRRR